VLRSGRGLKKGEKSASEIYRFIFSKIRRRPKAPKERGKISRGRRGKTE